MIDDNVNIQSSGSLYCNKEILLSIVALATKEVPGVSDLYRPLNLSLEKIVNRNVIDGVKIKSTQTGLLVDVYVVIYSDYEVTDVVYRVQQNIKNSISSMLDTPIKAINVHIMDTAIKK